MSRNLLVMVLTLIGCCSLLSADTIMVDPGQVVQYTFTANPVSFGCPPTFTASACDALLLLVPFVSPIPNSVTANLFDGSTLLGSFSGICCEVAFHSASSLFGLGSVVDFTSIRSGSIDGIIDLSSSQPFNLDTDTGTILFLAHATGVDATSESNFSATLTGISVVPEPTQSASVTLLAFLAFLGLARLKRALE